MSPRLAIRHILLVFFIGGSLLILTEAAYFHISPGSISVNIRPTPEPEARSGNLGKRSEPGTAHPKFRKIPWKRGG
ncbi:hypothetical protein ZWY2020_002621 [Hordeum vulgare]|nr:hypothetical protein ZWY2020_002621 [Hordeum vulgare]